MLIVLVKAVLGYLGRSTKEKAAMKKVNPQKQKSSGSTLGPVTHVPLRKIHEKARLQLFVRAGGRCEFDGCNQYLMEHHLTKTQGNFGQMAHIVAFSKNGPRGASDRRPADINDAANLMLLCHQCHQEIDDHPGQYSIATLRRYKDSHEQRIFHVTGLGPDLKTTIVQLKANIGDQMVDIPAAQVTEAIAPHFPVDARGHIIDLTGISSHGEAFTLAATDTIKQNLVRLYAPGMDVDHTRHISLFALAPMPLLVYLGSQLSNKIPVDFYQRHRDTGNWAWKTKGTPAAYDFRCLRTGTDPSKVAMLLSLSGVIHLANLPSDIDDRFSVYEITLDGQIPNPNYLRLKQDLVYFQSIYQSCLRMIGKDHNPLSVLHLFPAVPAPVAIACGYELLPKADPALYVYDYDKAKDGFTLAIRINEK